MNNTLIINEFKNGYGIKKLKIRGNPEMLRNVSIYASNGIFKTSFAKVIYDLDSNPANICDRLTGDSFVSDIKIGNDNFDNKKHPVIVFSKDILDKKEFSALEKELVFLTTNETLSSAYKEIESKISNYTNDLQKILKKCKIENALLNKCFGIPNIDSFEFLFEFLQKLSNFTPIEDIELVDLTQIKTKAGDFLDDESLLNQIKTYHDYLNSKLKSKIFDEKFNILSIDKFFKVLEEVNFFSVEKKRYLVIDGITYETLDSFKQAIENEIKSICSEPHMIETIKNIENMLGNTRAAEQIKKDIRENDILRFLYSKGRTHLVAAKILNNLYDFNIQEAINDIQYLSSEIERILGNAEKTRTKFEEAVEIFKKRFNSVFDVLIENKRFSSVNKQAPVIKFLHKRGNNVSTEQELRHILSSGELTTLNIIKFIVEYKSVEDKNPVIILDDVIETFDYSNRYAFIRYINELVENDANLILLTHNYEFYRTIKSRTQLKSLAAHCERDHEVIVSQNNNIFPNPKIFKNGNDKINKIDDLLFALPSSREISKLLGICTDDWLPFLHQRKETDTLLIKDLEKLLKKIKSSFCYEGNIENKYLDELYNYCDMNKRRKRDIFDLKFKSITAIAIRLKTEDLIINKNFSILKSINKKKNQTRELYNTYKEKFTENFIDLIEEVLIITPEFIHENVFMYEPLIDIVPEQLIDLYERVSSYNWENVWKPI